MGKFAQIDSPDDIWEEKIVNFTNAILHESTIIFSIVCSLLIWSRERLLAMHFMHYRHKKPF